MIHEDKIDFAALKSAVKVLNDLELVEKIRIVGTSKLAMATAFGNAIDELAEDVASTLPEEVAEQYNALYADEVAGAADVAAKPEKAAEPEKAVKAPKEKIAKEPKPTKEKKVRVESEKGPFGSTIGSGANAIDTLIVAGAAIEDIMAKAGVTRTRVVTHCKFLEKERGVTIIRDGEKVVGKVVRKTA